MLIITSNFEGVRMVPYRIFLREGIRGDGE